MALAVTAEKLRTLHRIHRQLADLQDRAAAGPRQIAARTKQLEAAEAKQASLLDEVKKAKLAADQKQLQLRSAEAKILDLEGKLNACKTNREYQTLRDQIAADRMATKVLEDEILEALERIDSIRKTVPAAEAEVAAAKKVLAEVKARVAAETATVEGEIVRVKSELETVERDLPEDARESYRRIVKSKGADAMAAVEAESCGGCCQQITGNMLSELAMGRVVVCRSCGRLLYLPESQPA
jgi:predicted  nucleic acid-binding Zn-ribbon protein